ncbi:MAG TPA: 2-C-methyl-D-erythritol 4-phosphate cytidylyltransferase, partial [Firmicutes bacterium]|nr:2-C-methyl-D-erythritol 4-phosphate cytidylyltransferase [Bacillota bacterium]
MSQTEADVVVVAAGESRRMGGGSSKLLLPLAGRPLLAWTLAPFQAAPRVRRVVLVIRDSDREAMDALVRREGLTKAQGHYAAGGDCRADSV